MAAPKGFPGNRHAGAKTLLRQAEAVWGYGNRERFPVDLDFPADGLVELGGHGSLRNTLPMRGSSDGLVFLAQHVVNEPLSLLLTNNCLANHSGGLEHVMGRLKNSLQVRRIALAERQLLTQLVERDTPSEDSPGPGDLDQTVEAACDGGRE